MYKEKIFFVLPSLIFCSMLQSLGGKGHYKSKVKHSRKRVKTLHRKKQKESKKSSKATNIIDNNLRHGYENIPPATWLQLSKTWKPTLNLEKEKKIIIVIPSYNNAQWYAYNLDSVFAQEYENYHVIYIDDCSPDSTGSLVKKFIKQRKQEHRVTLIRNQERSGSALSNIYKAVHLCDDNDIVVTLDGDDWLAHKDVFKMLNEAYEDTNVWLTYGQFITYPDNNIGGCKQVLSEIISNNSYREYQWTSSHLRTFYAWLFKKIKLEDLLLDGKFYSMAWDLAFMFPMLEMSGGKFKFIEHVNYVYNIATQLNDYKLNQNMQIALANEIRSKQKYLPINASFALSTENSPSNTDLIIFSYDRPMQLYALLESTEKYITGISNTKIIYRISDDRFERAYQKVKTAFEKVTFFKQSEGPHQDFKPLLINCLANGSSKYVLFAVDDIIVKDFVDLQKCICALEQTQAYAFFLRLGKNIKECYMLNAQHDLPPLVHIKDDIFAWQFKMGKYDWHYPNNVDMTLYRKADIKIILEQMNYINPNTLEGAWAGQWKGDNKIGLCFEISKIINIPLNLVNKSENKYMNSYSTQELLVKSEQGFRIDISKFFKIDNRAPHMECGIKFIN